MTAERRFTTINAPYEALPLSGLGESPRCPNLNGHVKTAFATRTDELHDGNLKITFLGQAPGRREHPYDYVKPH